MRQSKFWCSHLQKESTFRTNLKKPTYFLGWFLARKLSLWSTTPAVTLQSHLEFTPKSSNAAVWPLAHFLSVIFFSSFYQEKLGRWVGPQLLGEFTATSNNQEVNIEFDSKLLAMWKMSKQRRRWSRGGVMVGPHTIDPGFRKCLFVLLKRYIIDRKPLWGDC